MGPYAGVDYNLTLCSLQNRLQHIYRRQPYARVGFIPQSGTLDLASVIYCNLIQGRGEGGGELNQREGLRGKSLQSWVENTTMTDCFSLRL